jgi:UDP-glucose 4-epimerase
MQANKYAIFGASGLLGAAVVKKLITEGKEVWAFSRKKPRYEAKNLHWVDCDISKFDLGSIKESFDAVLYLAQSKKFRDFPNESQDILDINVNFPVKLALWSKQNGVKKFLITSSGGVYTDTKKNLNENDKIDANINNGFYLATKLSSELLINSFQSFFEGMLIIRPFFIYGPGQDNSMLIPRLMNRVINGEAITLNGKDGILINPIYVEDAADLIINAVKLEGSHVLNLAGEEVTSLRQICDLIGSIVNKKPIYDISATLGNDLVADVDIMKSKLGNVRINLIEGLTNLYKSMS